MYEYTYRIAAFDTNRNAKSNHFHYISKHVISRKKRKKIQLIIVICFVSTRFMSTDKKCWLNQPISKKLIMREIMIEVGNTGWNQL